MINNHNLLFSRLELMLIHAEEDRELATNLAKAISGGNVRCSFAYVAISKGSSLQAHTTPWPVCDVRLFLITPNFIPLNEMSKMVISSPDIPIAYHVKPSDRSVPSNLKGVVWIEMTDANWNLAPIWRLLSGSAQTKASVNARDWSRGVSQILWTTIAVLSVPISIIAGIIGFGSIYDSVASASYQDTAQFFGLLLAIPGAVVLGFAVLAGVLLGGQALAKLIQAAAYTYWCASWRQ